MNIVSEIVKQSQPVEEITSIDSATFKKNYFNKKKPVIIKGFAKDWGATKNWDLDFLLNLKEDKNIFLLSDNFIQDDNRYKKASFKKYIQQLKDAESNNTSVKDYLTTLDIFEYYPHLKSDIDFSFFEKHTKVNDITAWIGPANTISGFHADTANNVYAQIRGKKMFIISSTKFNKTMYPSKKHIYGAVASDVDINNFNNTKFPEFKNNKFKSVVLEPGDVLFVPQNWWHYVQALAPSISISNFGYTKFEVYSLKFKERIIQSLHKRGFYKPNNCFCCEIQ
ncbi:cupin-like domain-containing protein [Sabulilitoribacter arenilitoris]|uniref:Cupin-like domain-containing protein n=1 Tax=Wocania arenilitoris TaxID=2044858 RepID=A0AAE3ER12_9FLAO|nr:cupin-like domain-containing protein [Wocania arenilitoris]MCF7568619.1 cupin-like domain-containing protein [Wocania arenilitoris]